MNTKLYGIGVIGVVVLAGGFFAYKQMHIDPLGKTPVIGGVETVADQENHSGKKIAFSELIQQQGTYRCTVTQHVQNTDSEGVVYIHKDRIRGDFNSSVQGMNMQTSFISRDGYTYSWSSMIPVGMKIKNGVQQKGIATGSTQMNMSASYGFNGDQIGEYNCEAWTPDESKFTLPSSVTFNDLQAQ